MSLIDEINKVKEESYEKWFERWYHRNDIENWIRISASQGYSSIGIAVSGENDEYTKRRLNDPKVIEKLKDELAEFEIKYEESSGDRVFLGIEVGTWYKKVISIGWEAEQ